MTIPFFTGAISFVFRSQTAMYFTRNLKGFMIQGGDPTGTGKGGQSIWGKPFADEVRSTLKVSTGFSCSSLLLPRCKFNSRGVVAMANAGPDTNKSQFFITFAKQSHLDGKYTILGKQVVAKSLIKCQLTLCTGLLMGLIQHLMLWKGYQ
jgi:cyclophilin family peptidyl-prolyl cis-trans isomerase